MTKIMQVLFIGENAIQGETLTLSLANTSFPSFENRQIGDISELSVVLKEDDPKMVFLFLGSSQTPDWNRAFAVLEQVTDRPLIVLAKGDPPAALVSLFDQNGLGVVIEPGLDGKSLAAVLSQLLDRSRLVNKLVKNALFDPLTALPGQDLFLDRFQTAVHRVGRLGFGFGLAFCDIDGMSEINKQWGYDIGDQVFRQIALRFRERMRKSDTTARLGGDLFALIFENVIREVTLSRLAEKIHAAISRPYKVIASDRSEELEVELKFSMGLCLFPQHLTDHEGLFAAVRQALAKAKKAGGHQIAIFQPEVNDGPMGTLSLA